MTDSDILAALAEVAVLLRLSRALLVSLVPPDGDGERRAA